MNINEFNSYQIAQLDYWKEISTPYSIDTLKRVYPYHKFLDLDVKDCNIVAFLSHDIDFSPERHLFVKADFTDRAKEHIGIYSLDDIQKIIDLEKEYGLKSTIFSPVFNSKFTRFTSNLSKILDSRFELGLHASPRCSSDAERLIYEKKLIEKNTGRDVDSCRIHRLEYHYQKTIDSLKKAGFLYDSTFGYNNTIGFRGGISHIFMPYKKNVIEIPLTIMDMTLWKYLRLSPTNSLKLIQELINRATQNGGIITLNWHSDYASYDEFFTVFRKTIEFLIRKDARFITINQIKEFLG